MRVLITILAVLLAVTVADYLLTPPPGLWLLASLFLVLLILLRGVAYVVFHKVQLTRDAFRSR